MDDATALKARTTLAIFGVGVVLAASLLIVCSTIPSPFGAATPAVLVGLAAFAGACAGRMRWISYFAFKTKSFDASLIPHHYSWAVTGTAVVLAFLALPAQTGLLGANVATYALAFALGAFSEDVWDALHGRIRAFLGKAPRDDPVLPDIKGIDAPLDALGDVVLDGGLSGAEAVEKLKRVGVTYGHELVAWRDAKKIATLADRAGIPAGALAQLANVADELRDPAHLRAGIEQTAKAQQLALRPRTL